MNNNKAIITRFTVEYFDRETVPIFDSENIYELKEFIKFPYDAEINSLCMNNKFIIEDQVYLIRDFSINIYNAVSSVRDFNLTVTIFVDEIT